MTKLILSAVFFLFSSALWAEQDTNIRISLEEPSSSAPASGISNLRGWAVAPNGIDHIELFINGAYVDNIPYGSIRTDVGTAFPSYPNSDNSGYSMAWNYGALALGSNHVAVVGYDNLGNYNVSETDFQVEKFNSSFISDPNEVDLRTATNVRILDNNTLAMEGVTVEGQEWDVELKWQKATQGFDINLIESIIAPPPTEPTETEVGGIISSNTVWTLANSPYIITSEVQIAHSITLTIDPGVRVIGNNETIRVFGTLNADGTESSRIIFDTVHITPGRGEPGEQFKMFINYADINSGSVYSGVRAEGSISLRNSVLTEIPYLYLWHPTETSFIEKNIFIRFGGISIGTWSADVYIRNNVFHEGLGGGYGIENFGSDNTSKTVVEYNSFLSTDEVALTILSGYTSADIATATNNYWGTVDTAVIDSMIYDRNDDLDVANYIVYEPILTVPHPDTPIF